MACKNCCAEQDNDNDNITRRRRYHDHHHQQQHQSYFDSVQSSTAAAEETEYMKCQMGELRKDNNRMVLEAAYLRKENTLYLKRLKEEYVVRERLVNQIQKLRVKENSLDDNHRDTESFKAIDSDLIREQLKAYRDDFNEEKRIRERYCRRNVELENQLEEAKQIVEDQQKKLLLYDQILSQPLRYKLDVPITFPQQNTSTSASSKTIPLLSSSPPLNHQNKSLSSSPSSPSSGSGSEERTHIARIERKRYPRCSNDHIIEATLMSGHQQPRITRASSTESPTKDRDVGFGGGASSYSRCSEDHLPWSLDSSVTDIITKAN